MSECEHKGSVERTLDQKGDVILIVDKCSECNYGQSRLYKMQEEKEYNDLTDDQMDEIRKDYL